MKLKKRINEEDILEEIREERESNRKVFRMKAGRRMMAISNEPMVEQFLNMNSTCLMVVAAMMIAIHCLTPMQQQVQ